jgi:E3 ubiquitin-protein ligase RNF144
MKFSRCCVALFTVLQLFAFSLAFGNLTQEKEKVGKYVESQFQQVESSIVSKFGAKDETGTLQFLREDLSNYIFLFTNLAMSQVDQVVHGLYEGDFEQEKQLIQQAKDELAKITEKNKDFEKRLAFDLSKRNVKQAKIGKYVQTAMKMVESYSQSIIDKLLPLYVALESSLDQLHELSEVEKLLIDQGVIQEGESLIPSQSSSLKGSGIQGASEKSDSSTTEEPCSICLEVPEEGNKLVALLQCQHEANYCFNCMRDHINFSSENHPLNALKCPDVHCAARPLLVDLTKYIEPTQLVRLRQRALEVYQNQGRLFMFCQTDACTGVGFRKQGEKVFKCTLCKQKYCYDCGVKGPKGKSCKSHIRTADRNKIDDLKMKKIIQICPKCGNGVIRTKGCSYMKCRCGTRFTYKGNYHDTDDDDSDEDDYTSSSSSSSSDDDESEEESNSSEDETSSSDEDSAQILQSNVVPPSVNPKPTRLKKLKNKFFGLIRKK